MAIRVSGCVSHDRQSNLLEFPGSTVHWTSVIPEKDTAIFSKYANRLPVGTYPAGLNRLIDTQEFHGELDDPNHSRARKVGPPRTGSIRPTEPVSCCTLIKTSQGSASRRPSLPVMRESCKSAHGGCNSAAGSSFGL